MIQAKYAIPYGRQSITQEDLDAVIATLTGDYLTQGPKIREFEEAFAQYVGAKYAVAVNNGTAALHLAAMALNAGPGTKVITTPITFAASANCIGYCGGSVEFVDIDPATGLISIPKVRELLKKSSKGTYSGIIPVDFAGKAVDLEALRELADEYGLWIIEDACHSPGGYFTDKAGNRQMCGNGRFAECAAFSFHPVKHIACGEGGMVTTNDMELYNRMMILRTHGITKDPQLMHENHGGWYYEMQQLGYNYRLTDFQAALGITQLGKADAGLERRRQIARRYDAAFAGSQVDYSIGMFDPGHAYHLYVIKVKNRKELYDELRNAGIYAQVHYIPVHLLPYYRGLGHRKGDHPHAEELYEKCLSLPMFPTLTDEEQEFVIKQVLHVAK